MRVPPRSSIQALALAATLTVAGAHAQTASAPTPPTAPAPAAASNGGGLALGTSNNPIDVSSEGLDVFQAQHLSIFKGNVEATQDQARLRSPELWVYSKPKPQTPGAKPAAGSAVAPDMGSVDHIVAAGPVYYITPTENARGDNGLWEAGPNVITLTGNVVLVQGKSVGKGDKLVINRNTGESNLISFAPKTATGRVRVIMYPQQQQPTAGAGAKPAAPPAKS